MHAIRMFVFQQKKSDSNKLKNEKKKRKEKKKAMNRFVWQVLFCFVFCFSFFPATVGFQSFFRFSVFPIFSYVACLWLYMGKSFSYECLAGWLFGSHLEPSSLFFLADVYVMVTIHGYHRYLSPKSIVYVCMVCVWMMVMVEGNEMKWI